MHVLGIAGSLRKASFNRALLRAAQELAPKGMEITVFDLDPIPPYNEDVEKQGDPVADEQLVLGSELVGTCGEVAGRGAHDRVAQSLHRRLVMFAHRFSP